MTTGMTGTIEADYLVIGAGGMGMAFTDTLLTETDGTTVVMVDRGHAPGGHWNESYPFVRLHQPSTFYGVNSRELGNDTIDQVGLNKGCYELASGAEVCAYFDQVMNQQFLPSGRVTYLPMHDYAGNGEARSLVGDGTQTIRAKKVVDATYMHVKVPAQRPPKYKVAEGAVCVPPNGLARLGAARSEYVIVGSGKTGIDAILFLMKNGVSPDAITWIMPADAYYFDRMKVNPGRKFTDPIIQGAMNVMAATLEAKSADDLMDRVEAMGEVLRFDAHVRPTRWRCATITQAELDEIRKIKNIVRMGWVSEIKPGQVVLADGTLDTAADALYVDCAADGLEKRPVVPVFQGEKLVLQSVRMCQQVFSAAFIANVEAHYTDDAKKNAICQPVPHPYTAHDYLRTALQNSQNMLNWVQEPKVVEWLNGSRLEGFAPVIDLHSDDPEVQAAMAYMVETMTAAVAKLGTLLEDAGEPVPQPVHG